MWEKAPNYKYHVSSRVRGYRVDKADPFALYSEVPPRTGSIIWDLDYTWGDGEWMEQRAARNAPDAPFAIYEAHLGSWMRAPEEGNRFLTYRELAPRLTGYLRDMGFTHVEFLPIMEHPFYGSWGYQTTGYFTPSSRFGTPQDFMYLVDQLHQNGIGVILDWVPSHFPKDEHSLGYFDGTYLFEHADPRQRVHPDWDSLIFNYGRTEVQSYLLSSAMCWLDRYHADGLRVDAVASMLVSGLRTQAGEWIPNKYGGNENLEAISFLRRFNEEIYKSYPDVQTIAEESTAWPMVSRPTYVGGLGFGMKWDMGWMHDTLEYMSKDPVHRTYHHNKLTFRMVYAFRKISCSRCPTMKWCTAKDRCMRKMPGDDWQKFANLRLLFGYMYAQPAKKLLFMGGEIGQWDEWYHEASLAWGLLDHPLHSGLHRWTQDLNHFYRNEPALHELDFDPAGFSWIDCNDATQSTLSLMRKGRDMNDRMVVVFNFTPVPRPNYRVGVPRDGFWKEAMNSDATLYGGSGQGNLGGLESAPIPYHGHRFSLNMTLPPLAAVFFKQDTP